ncbi:MAG: hypothetical protein ACRDOO_08245 [Actinomadura sp.]
MIIREIRSEDQPVSERFGYWNELTAHSQVSTFISSDHQDDFRAISRSLNLGTAYVFAMTYPSLRSRRTAKLIRRSDPEKYEMSLVLRGERRVAQAGRDASYGPHDLVIFDSSRPFEHQLIAPDGGDITLLAVHIPKAQFPGTRGQHRSAPRGGHRGTYGNRCPAGAVPRTPDRGCPAVQGL